MTTEIFGVINIELRIEGFKRSIAPELSDFSLIDKRIIVLVELYAVSFQPVHTLKADTVIFVTAGKLIDLKLTLCLFHIINGADRIFLFEIVKYLLFLSGKRRMEFQIRNKDIQHISGSFLAFRCIVGIIRRSYGIFTDSADMVNETSTARTLAVTDIKPIGEIELLSVHNSPDLKVCFLVVACIKVGDHTLLMLFIVKILHKSICKRKADLAVFFRKVTQQTAFGKPAVIAVLRIAELKFKAVGLSFRLKSNIILCDDSKSVFGLHFITENIIESLFDTVELRTVISLFPISHSSTVKCSEKITDPFIGNVRNSLLQIVTNPPESEIVKFLMDTVNESLSDFLKGNKTFHTAETALETVLSPLRMQGVAEVFSIIIGTV